MLFFIERSRINCVRDYCKFIVFNIIKTRYFKYNENFYIIAQKMIEDLNNIYGEFDFYDIVNIKLHNLDFNIKNKKIFNEFLIRYIIIIALL